MRAGGRGVAQRLMEKGLGGFARRQILAPQYMCHALVAVVDHHRQGVAPGPIRSPQHKGIFGVGQPYGHGTVEGPFRRYTGPWVGSPGLVRCAHRLLHVAAGTLATKD
ncbi:MAG TPA: hypothetical protein DDY62_04455 [Cryomorphaceae bacterium]|nr:hypothetical protein [Cryomorphaceae bacterium]